MDMQINSPHPELGRLEQIVSQFLLKSLHIILDSRIPSFRSHERSTSTSGEVSYGSRVKKSDKWFSLVLGDRPASLDNLNFWHRNLMDPMIIDIILVQQGPERASVETVIERWVVQYECPRVVPYQSGESSPASYKRTYKKSIIMLRSLYSTLRFLPAYRIFQQLRSSNQSYSFDIIYKVSSFSEPFGRAEEGGMKEYVFMPVEALPGSLCVSVTYHPTPLNFDLEVSTSMPPKIIMDYVGSPATDPLRSFPSSDKDFSVNSFSLRGTRPPSSPFQRPHSWSSGFHREAFTQNQLSSGSPPTYRTSPISYDLPSPSPPDIYGHRFYNSRPGSYQNATSFDEYQLSPPFSPSPSPSPPNYNFSGTRLPPESAPVTIPLPIMSRTSRYLSPNSSDSGRHSLPPPSPRSTKLGPSSQDSPSGIRSFRKTDASKTTELCPGGSNHYLSQKITKDSKEDSGRFSGLLSSSDSPRIGFSRSSSRLSFQDDLDDCDFSCPFDVDDVDVTSSNTSQNIDGRKASEYSSHHLLMGRKSQSQDAAVGVLVHMLKTAPPLRQDPSYSSHSMKIEPEGETGSASAFFMPRKATDALEELRSYKELKDLLLSKSGTQLIKHK